MFSLVFHCIIKIQHYHTCVKETMVLVTEVPMLDPMIIGIAVLDETLLEQNTNLINLCMWIVEFLK
jgi:hypothetical protein